MGSIYEARWKNAHKIGNKIKNYLDKGYLVFDADGVKIESIRIDEEGLFINGGMYFLNEINLDNGYYETVKEFNSWFSNWLIVHPKHCKKLINKRKVK